MKRNFDKLILQLGLAGFLAMPLCGQNLLLNPGFEEPVVPGDLVGWERRGSPDHINLVTISEPVVEGASALLIEGRTQAVWNGIKQVLAITAGTTYTISGHVRLADGEAEDTIVIQLIKTLSDGSTGYQSLVTGPVTASEYREFRALFTMPETNVEEATLSIHGASLGVSFIVDDFLVEESVAPDTIMNGSFEGPVDLDDGFDWDRRGGTVTVEQIESPVLDGNYALQVAGRDPAQEWNGIKHVINLEPGTHYRFSGAMKLAPEETDDAGVIQVGKTFEDGSIVFQDLFRGDISASDYTRFESEFTIEETDIVSMFISVHGPTEGKSFIVDNFYLETFVPVSLWDDFDAFNNGWLYGWLGWIVELESDWIYHLELGYLFVHGESVESLWFYDLTSDEWFWSSRDSYPYIYTIPDGWVF